MTHEILKRSKYFALVLLTMGPALAPAQQQVCKAINARLATVAFLDGCESPVDFCAQGVITGDGLIQGRTVATVLGLIPSVGFDLIEPATTMGYVGDRVIETPHGDLNLRFTGVFDTVRGEFSELSRVIVEEGSGRFYGATGTLYVVGRSNAAGNEFFGDISGTICHSSGN